MLAFSFGVCLVFFLLSWSPATPFTMSNVFSCGRLPINNNNNNKLKLMLKENCGKKLPSNWVWKTGFTEQKANGQFAFFVSKT